VDGYPRNRWTLSLGTHGHFPRNRHQIPENGEKAVEKILELLKFDFHLRPFLARKFGLRVEGMDFFFGRPLTETIVMFGLKVERQPDGGFLLTKRDW